MKNKGFTLIELLAVIAILGILATITVPTIVNLINGSKEDSLEEQKRVIVDAAKRYYTDNIRELPTTDSSKEISVTFLKKEGYLKMDDITDPTTNEEMVGCVEVTRSNKQYKYVYKDTCD